jgi:23S rRNA-/tRNA-specific pseudouridylate synthase
VNPAGLSSHTEFRLLRKLDGLSLVECVLHTGRTHQIRVHLEAIGFPILGDKIYGQPDEVFLGHLKGGQADLVLAATKVSRHFLHAHRISLTHPSGGEIEVECPLPEDMRSVLFGSEQ